MKESKDRQSEKEFFHRNSSSNDSSAADDEHAQWVRLQAHVDALRFDLSTAPPAMPQSAALHMLRAAQGGADGSPNPKPNSKPQVDGFLNPHYVPNSAAAIDVPRGALLQSAAGSNCR